MSYLIVWGILLILGTWMWCRARANDPVYNCKRYVKVGCPHVDGMACDMKTCSIKDKV